MTSNFYLFLHIIFYFLLNLVCKFFKWNECYWIIPLCLYINICRFYFLWKTWKYGKYSWFLSYNLIPLPTPTLHSNTQFAMRKKCPHSDWIRREKGEMQSISPYSVRIRENRTRKTPNTVTFHAVTECDYVLAEVKVWF